MLEIELVARLITLWRAVLTTWWVKQLVRRLLLLYQLEYENRSQGNKTSVKLIKPPAAKTADVHLHVQQHETALSTNNEVDECDDDENEKPYTLATY